MAKIPGTIKKRAGSPLLWFRIRNRGREFYVQTETASKREAERNKRLYYEQAKAKIAAADVTAQAGVTKMAQRYRGICECGEHAWAILTLGLSRSFRRRTHITC